MSHQPDMQDKNKSKASGFVIPLEDILMPIVFVAAIAIAVVLCRSWLALPFWVSCLLGVPAAFVSVLGVIWLLSLISKRNQ